MDNPFSTKYWSAGVIPFRFSQPGESIELLLKFIQKHPVSQIVGSHGSGKSTLLYCLMKRFEKSGDKVRYLFFNDQSRQLPRNFAVQPGEMVFVDGFEQLRIVSRLRLRFGVKRLIFTTHRTAWFTPIVYRTKPEFSVFVQIVRQLVSVEPKESVLRAVYARSGGNFRSAFFELYDQEEMQRRNC